MQHAVDQLAAFVAIGQGYHADGSLKKRKSDGSATFGRGAPGQKRFCPLCKNSDGSPTPLAGAKSADPQSIPCWYYSCTSCPKLNVGCRTVNLVFA